MKRKLYSRLPDEPAGSLLTPTPADGTANALKNWAGNIIFSTNQIVYPESVAEVQALILKHDKVKALGSGHCFNHIADSRHLFVSTRNLNKVVNLNAEAHTITVESGIKYGELAPYLQAQGFALPNLASLPHISVAGSVITATHGSGVTNGNLATAVTALEMVTATGEVQTLSKDKNGDIFDGIVVNLGALGFITKITLALQPSFNLRQNVYEKLPLEQLAGNFREIMGAGYSVSLFTNWQQDYVNAVWIKSRTDADTNFNNQSAFLGAKAATQNLHPIANLPAENCTEQMGVPGPWYERLPHFKMGFTPSSGVELQSEYFVPAEHAVAAIEAVAGLGKLIAPHLLVSEIRSIAADNLWLSPCYKQNSIALHFTWKQDWPAVSKLLPLLENALAPFKARPHWGKLFTVPPPELAPLYPRLPDFKALAQHYDPQGKFRNNFLETNIFND